MKKDVTNGKKSPGKKGELGSNIAIGVRASVAGDIIPTTIMVGSFTAAECKLAIPSATGVVVLETSNIIVIKNGAGNDIIITTG